MEGSVQGGLDAGAGGDIDVFVCFRGKATKERYPVLRKMPDEIFLDLDTSQVVGDLTIEVCFVCGRNNNPVVEVFWDEEKVAQKNTYALAQQNFKPVNIWLTIPSEKVQSKGGKHSLRVVPSTIATAAVVDAIRLSGRSKVVVKSQAFVTVPERELRGFDSLKTQRLFADDFSAYPPRSNGFPKWRLTNEIWEVKSGKFTKAEMSCGDGLALDGDLAWKDYLLEVKLRILSWGQKLPGCSGCAFPGAGRNELLQAFLDEQTVDSEQGDGNR